MTKLGAGRFTVTRPLSPGAKVSGGHGTTIDTRTRSMLAEAESTLGRDLVLEQGSYNPGGDPTSAGTHDGGGVVDIDVAGMSAAVKTTVVRTLRQVGDYYLGKNGLANQAPDDGPTVTPIRTWEEYRRTS